MKEDLRQKSNGFVELTKDGVGKDLGMNKFMDRLKRMTEPYLTCSGGF